VPCRARRDGWTAERQRTFIAALARTGRVGRSALEAGMSRESAYRLRRRKGAESFAAAWDEILAARPRGSSSLALIWHRLVRKYGGPGAVRREAAPADREARNLPAPGPAEERRARGRSQ
jgi:NAD-dependent oxidoreductase involved in siderophore biosynthesis